MKTWRPKGWIHGGGLQDEVNGEEKDNYYTDVYEAGADAMLKALYKLASESPTGTFIIDSKAQYIYSEERGVKC